MTRILMVCLGNICRSPLAHGILESKLNPNEFYVDSAGTGNYHIGESPDVRSIKVAKQNGIDISHQTCRQFQLSDFETFDRIYVMDVSNFQTVVKLARNPNDIAKVEMIGKTLNTESSVEIPDPYYGNQTDFEQVFNLLNTICETIAFDLQRFK